MKTFDVTADTVPVAEYAFTGQQGQKAQAVGAVRVFDWSCLQGQVKRLPKYVQTAITAAGYRPVVLGGTTYKYSVIGLVPMASDLV